jgi:glyoxylase-like metal-dependent hydrolase (beta-lactamase superfamily II)
VPRRPNHLGDGVWQFQTSLWETNAVLVETGGATILCDPSWTAEEIAAIRERATGTGKPVHVLITHSDFDHTCGIGFFPDAVVTAGSETAAAIAAGRAAEGLASAAAEWGLSWPLELRVDRTVEPGGWFACDGSEVLAIEARGHVGDGLAYFLREPGVLLAGDYLSPMTYPFVLSSLADAIATSNRLLEVIAEHRPRWVIPGHGRPLGPEEAHEIGTADLAYLERLAAAATDAKDRRLSSGDALVAVYGVEPPRTTTDDFDLYGLRTINARTALAEKGSFR